MKNLVKHALERDFDFAQYSDLVKNLFNEIQIQPQEIKVPDSFKEFIRKITFLSEFSDAQKKTIDVYAVELAGGTKVERARSSQRNIISKLLKDNTKDAGLVAFYSKDNPDWRLSFIKLDYKLTERGVKVEVGTPPKRYSFLVGQSEPSHTAQKQLLPILEDQKNNPLLSDLEEAFSVERVTKEFYERYRKLFEDLAKDLKKNTAFQIIAEKENIDIENFAKKLLGQIVFLYFLQKKGWLGVPQDKTWGQGDKFFLRTLFNQAKIQNKDFYNDYLEILFYDTLNNPRRDEVDPAYSRYFDCKIPFLNGGLFEPDYDWKNTFVTLGNNIFEEIIETFNLYNFTVKEDEPLEKEVAVDPEMLGKVFENLLPENMRKGQGAYYTPREIVHYMCQESLINHLNTETKIDAERIKKLITLKDEDLVNGNGSREKNLGFSDNEAQSIDRALANIKVCDPACGSGAFLVGMLNEIVSARRILQPRSEYKLKKETIQECIYGVDIDPGAVDIAKLRLWLSLVVDFELRDIEPLPNLDYKIMCGNSLLEELVVGEESIKLFDERLLNLKEVKNIPSQDTRIEELKKQLEEKQKELRDSVYKISREKQKELEGQILIINKELNPKPKKIKTDVNQRLLFADKAEEYFKVLKELHKQFFTDYDPVRKKERRKQIEGIELEFIKSSIKEKIEELDTKIKNLNMQDPGDRKKQAEFMKKRLEYLVIPERIHNSKGRPYFLWKLNLFEVFQENGGFDVVIANPPYIDSENMVKSGQGGMREAIQKTYAMTKGNWDIYIAFFELGFKVMNSRGTLTFITPDKWISKPFGDELRKNKIGNMAALIRAGRKVFESAKVDSIISFFSNKQSRDIRILDYDGSQFIFKRDIKKSSLNSPFTLDHLFSDRLDFLDKIERSKNKVSDFSSSENACATSDAYKLEPFISELTDDNFDPKKHLKIINTGTIGRFCMRWGIREMVYLKHKYLCPVVDRKKFLAAFPNSYGKKSIQPKIILKGLNLLDACLDKDGIVIPGKTTIIIASDDIPKLKFLLAILNSKLPLFYIKERYPASSYNQGTTFTREMIDNLPIPEISESKKQQLVAIVDKIISIGIASNEAQKKTVVNYENQIDEIVMGLYGLSPEEITLINRSFE